MATINNPFKIFLISVTPAEVAGFQELLYAESEIIVRQYTAPGAQSLTFDLR
jgi:hypothetical protein